MVLQILFLGPSNLLEPKASFAQMSQKLIVSPIVKTLVFCKVPEKASHHVQYRLLDHFFLTNFNSVNTHIMLLVVFISILNM